MFAYCNVHPVGHLSNFLIYVYSIYILLVCLWTINVKTVSPIESKKCVTTCGVCLGEKDPKLVELKAF